MHRLSPKPDWFYHTKRNGYWGYQNPFYIKQAQQKQQSLYNGKVIFEKHDSPAFLPIPPFFSPPLSLHYFISSSCFLSKLENENVELEFQVRNYEKEIAHLKTTYKNLFDSIKVTRTQTKAIIDSLQDKLHDTIYENAKLRAQLFDKVSDQKDTNKGTSANTKFAKQSILGKPPSSSRPKLYVVTHLSNSTAFPKVGETNALSKPVTSNSVPSSRESTMFCEQ
ncbi:hypothetical protein Tco_0968564 [Tanacetum coccineum]